MRTLTALLLASIVFQAGCVNKELLTDPFVIGAVEKVDVVDLEPKALQIVREALADDSGIMRNHAVEAIVTARRRELMPLVLKLLSDEFVAVRFAACVAVGDMEYRPGEYMVRPLLEDPNANARIGAAYALARLGRSGYVQMIRAATRSTDQTVRANAALLLGKLGDRNNLPLLYEVLRDPESADKARFQAVESIARLGDERIYKDKLWALLISKFADDRVLGIRAMGLLNTVDSRNAIATMLNDEVMEVRLCAAEQLARTGDLTGEPLIAGYFERQRPNLNKSSVANMLAAMALGWMPASAEKYLSKLLDSRAKAIRLAAAQSVLVLVPPKARPSRPAQPPSPVPAPDNAGASFLPQ